MRDPKGYYDAMGKDEWRRLVRDPYHRLEFEVTMHFLKRYLPKQGRILDAGGGPGRYSIELAEMGHEVALLDFSPVQLDVARANIHRRRKEIRNRITEIVEGNVVDLSMYEDESFDAVLCLGPLSHLIDEKERRKAAKELVRVLKRGSPIFAQVFGRFGVYRVLLQYIPSGLTDPSHESFFTEGIHYGHEDVHEDRKYHSKKIAFPDAYFFLPEEIPELFEEHGVETLHLASCEGLSAHLQRPTNALYRDKEKWEKWFQIILETCTEPSIVGVGQHLLYVGRKE